MAEDGAADGRHLVRPIAAEDGAADGRHFVRPIAAEDGAADGRHLVRPVAAAPLEWCWPTVCSFIGPRAQQPSSQALEPGTISQHSTAQHSRANSSEHLHQGKQDLRVL